MIQNAVTLLAKANPEALLALRGKFPEQNDLLKSARELGTVDDEPSPEGLRHREAIVEMLRSTIQTERVQIDGLLLSTRQRMVLVARTKLFGSIISTASSALTAVFVYAGGGQPLTAMVSALVAMGGALGAIFADYFERAPSGVKITSAEEYGKLVEMRSAIERAKTRLERGSLFRLDDEELETIAKTVDEFAGEIVRLSFA